jgi:uncharacterized membrane protein
VRGGWEGMGLLLGGDGAILLLGGVLGCAGRDRDLTSLFISLVAVFFMFILYVLWFYDWTGCIIGIGCILRFCSVYFVSSFGSSSVYYYFCC